MPFKPFSLAESIQAGQTIKMNQMKIQAAEQQAARTERLRGLAQMSTRPTYGPTEGPPEASGARPQIQTGTEYSPEVHAEKIAAAGETEMAADMQKQIASMSKAQREEADSKATEFAQLVASAKGDPDIWAQNSQIAAEKGYITPEQIVPYSDERWQRAMNDASTVKDMLAAEKAASKRGVSTTLQEIEYLESIKDPKEREEKEALMMALKGRNKIKKIEGNSYLVGQDGSLYLLGTAKAEAEFEEAKAEAKKTGTLKGEAKTTAKIDLPKIKSDAEYLKGIVRSALDHPGFKSVVGMPSLGKLTKHVGGTEEAGFHTIHKQITGKTFMEAYKTLKGGGQITEVEGQKATEALQRLDTALSEVEYIAAAEEFISEIDRLTILAEQRATGKEPASFDFSSVEEAEAAGLPAGTEITIGGRKAVVE